MRYIAGIDIGNSSTEVALARQDEAGALTITHSALAETTGIKGTLRNVFGIQEALALVAKRAGINVSDISLIRINEATPVIGDVAMETITETIITESTMIGHNPKTPGGAGLGVGITITPQELLTRPADAPYILVVSSAFDFADIAQVINASIRAGYQITGVILQRDDGVLVSNRWKNRCRSLTKCCTSTAFRWGCWRRLRSPVPGKVIETLSNPYGIATVFNLSPEETKNIVPMARALIGNRSAVVVKTPSGDVKARAIPAGNLELLAQGRTVRVDVAAGAEAIMKAVDGCGRLDNVTGESGTNIGGMLEHVRQTMAELTNKPSSEIFIQDLLAVDTSVPVSVTGGLAGEFSLEQAVGIASMVKSDRLQMAMIAREIEQKLNIDVQIGGAEAEAAILGGADHAGHYPTLAILDLGAGSTDASIINPKGDIIATHLAGAGDMVTMIIARELGAGKTAIWRKRSRSTRWPRWKVCSIYATRTAACSSSPRRCPRRIRPRLRGESGRTGAATRRLSTGKSARHSPHRQRAGLCHQRPARAASGQPHRQHSRYSVRGAGRRFVAGFRSPAGWSPMRWRTTAWLPDGEIFAAARAPETRWPPALFSPGIRSSRMDSNHSAPGHRDRRHRRLRRPVARSAAGYRRGRYPFPAPEPPGRRDRGQRLAGGAAAHRCWWASPATAIRWSCTTRIYPHRRRFLR
ncbi:propanediol dehydratase reactivation factor large subunit [Klebsiella michiganensis]|nr:propanediol dehydratase reactivation factor large subunit [Klebsiella michiganensis]